MKPIEEIPYGADVTRVIFVPKKSFKGLIRGHTTRISEICPYFFKIDVAVVKDSSSFQKGGYSINYKTMELFGLVYK